VISRAAVRSPCRRSRIATKTACFSACIARAAAGISQRGKRRRNPASFAANKALIASASAA
jgi:hypothetical protein